MIGQRPIILKSPLCVLFNSVWNFVSGGDIKASDIILDPQALHKDPEHYKALLLNDIAY